MEENTNKTEFTFLPEEEPQPEQRFAPQRAAPDEAAAEAPASPPEKPSSGAFDFDAQPEAEQPSPEQAKREREARRSAIRKKKIKRRRLAVAAVAAALLLVLVVSLAVKLIKRAVRGETLNVGPLPSETVSVQRIPKYYDYAAAAPEKAAVSGSYFADALLLGDTRVQCLDLYESTEFGLLLYGSAINVSDAMNYSCKGSDGSAGTLYEKLSLQRYGKVYLSLGLNELGWAHSDVFLADYTELVQAVRQLQPDAVIYVLAVFPVSAAKDGKVSYITNARIQTYNGLIRGMAESLGVYYLDCYAGMADESGALPAANTSDGVNLSKEGSAAWYSFFTTHTVDPEDYVN